MLSPIQPLACTLPIDDLQPDVVQSFVSQANHGADLTDAMQLAVRSLGFEHFSLAAGPQMKPNPASPKYLWTNVPLAWVRDYERRAYIEVDPRMDYFRTTGRPFVWDQTTAGKRKEVGAFMEDAASYGICSGLAIRIPDPDRFVVFALSSPDVVLSAARRRDLAHAIGDVFMLGMYLHDQVLEDRLHRYLPATSQRGDLTAREHECLQMVARGLKAKAIGRSLGISHRTVHYYVANVLTKLHATNREEAVARAMAMNLIEFPAKL